MRVLRLKEVMVMTGLARSTVYKFIAAGDFPSQVPLGCRSVGWIESEVVEWIKHQVAARDRS